MSGKRFKSSISADLPQECNKYLETVAQPHISSFNWMLEKALPQLCSQIRRFDIGNGVQIWFESLSLGEPTESAKDKRAITSNSKVYPTQCRQNGTTYGAPLYATICIKKDEVVATVNKSLGIFPIMVKSSVCNLYKMTPRELVAQHEEANEMGGYFIVNGNEKIIRLLSVSRRNDPIGVIRPSFKRLGAGYTRFGCIIRCVRDDQVGCTNTIHYLADGTSTLRVIIYKREYLIPLVILMKALIDTSDREIYERTIEGDTENTNISDRIELLLRETKKTKCFTREQCLSFLGFRFRPIIGLGLPEDISNQEVAEILIKDYILIHLKSNQDKFEMLIFMLRKLYALAAEEIQPDNLDSAMNHEVLTPGHVYLNFLRDRLLSYQRTVRSKMQPLLNQPKKALNGTPKALEELLKNTLNRVPEIGHRMSYFLATGNLVSELGIDLPQTSGWTIIAEKLNFLRYIAHFQCIHRGAFFAEMKTTTPRKLLPESWGFLCPVHTPDGAPCGLLNHLSSTCHVVDTPCSNMEAIVPLLSSLGMSPIMPSGNYPKGYLSVLIDGRVVGKIEPGLAPLVVEKLRYFKTKGEKGVPSMLEIAYVPPSVRGAGRYPGLFLFSTAARMMRPVKHLATGLTEYIGSFEQVYLNVACMDIDVREGVSTHQELDPTNMLSVVALLTPFSDFNQSPRNMYQCQMGKQTMGTPCHSFPYRVDNKLYRIQTPQKPIALTKAQELYGVNEYAHGANAVVAVISYTGYDMEDAMIINKSSYERGFGHGTVYKTEYIEMIESNYFDNILRQGESIGTIVNVDGKDIALANKDPKSNICYQDLDEDGLPPPGYMVDKEKPFYSYFNPVTGAHKAVMWKTKEVAYIDDVRIVQTRMIDDAERVTSVAIKYRFNRNPVIGDKFSSRHGQKGVLSQLWPQVDMPFSESGMTPDVIINPHAFPSRMTIGMLVESLAGKSGSLHGMFHNATPFQFNEKNTASDYFGQQLVKAGYNYYGNEPLYSGITGTEFHADIYLGVVYYQRLRHMVKDKFQVRSTGPINNITLQPVKGRKVGGGIRFGEMERDSLLAHGTSFLLHDRLFTNSDGFKFYACSKCGSILAPVSGRLRKRELTLDFGNDYFYCSECETDEGIKRVSLPFVFKYLTAELAAMGVKTTLFVK